MKRASEARQTAHETLLALGPFMSTRPLASPSLSLRQRLSGHVRTLRPFFERSFRPIHRPPTTAWSHEFVDPEGEPVRLTGQLFQGNASSAIVVLHGLGGSAQSGYMALALRAAQKSGVTCLLLNCRGADRLGGDIYHSGLTEDLTQALRSPVLNGMKTIDLFGYSIGGHIALRYATRDVDERVRRVAAIGSPLSLGRAADDFDNAPFNVYRGHVLDALKEIYTAAYQRRPRGIEPLVARKIHRIRDWDEQIVAPRFGYRSGADYYEKESVSTRLSDLSRDALYVGAVCDPMVQMKSVLPFVHVPRLKVVWDQRAGHLGFPEDFDLGLSGPLGVESQVFTWFSEGGR